MKTHRVFHFVLQLPVLLRLGCVGLVFVCNAVMWTVFTKALRLSSSSAAASVTTTASNFICSVSRPLLQALKPEEHSKVGMPTLVVVHLPVQPASLATKGELQADVK